jgi:hypothetical protein
LGSQFGFGVVEPGARLCSRDASDYETKSESQSD